VRPLLCSVLVHSGGIHGGHYYAFIRPQLGSQWFKFDDDRVTKETTKKAVEEQFGGEEEVGPPSCLATEYSAFRIEPQKCTKEVIHNLTQARIRKILLSGLLKTTIFHVGAAVADKSAARMLFLPSSACHHPVPSLQLPSHGFGNPPSFKFTKFSNAYMLVYIRVSDIENIMCEVAKDDVAEHLQAGTPPCPYLLLRGHP
jgi:hypothetical protein